METKAGELSVLDGEHLVGTIHDTDPLSFTYATGWLVNNDDVNAIPGIPLGTQQCFAPEVEAFFDNLLPEGVVRDMLSRTTNASSTFALLLAVAGDTAGGLTILPTGQAPEKASYTPVDWNHIAKHFSGGLQAQATTAPLGSRISLSGAQTKMLISLDGNNSPMLPIGTTPSTWIVKPNIRGFDQVWSSAINEAIMMRTAAHCGIGVAEVFFESVTRACIVKRFDRIVNSTGAVERLKQYDFCQLNGTAPGKKYEAEGGPGLAMCADLIRRHSASPAADLMRFFQWIIFNLYTGNNDSHAKNLSMLHLPGQGMRLTPFYDLMNTRLYPGLSTHFAFKVGGEDEPGKMTRKHLAAMSAELKVKPALIFDVAKSIHTKLGPALLTAISEIEPQLDHSGKTLSEKLRQHVMNIANKTGTRFTEADQSFANTSEASDIGCEKCNAVPCVCDVESTVEPDSDS